jgi:aspartyl protease family protein
VFGFAASLVIAPLCRADDADALKAKELVKNGTTYVLPAEQELADGMKDLRKLKVKLDSQSKQRRELEANLRIAKNAISLWDHQKRKLYEEYLKVNDITQKNQHVAQINILDSKLKEANDIREDLEKKVNGLGAEEKTQFINQVIDLGAKVDKAQDQYKDLAGDPDVKLALEKMNQPGKARMKIGPSPEFANNTNMLKKWRGDVSSETVQIKHDNNVPMVEVTFNGTVVRELVVDSGASMVCLTADLAKQLNMVPTDKDETIQFTQADGKRVEAKKMTLKSIRVGQFTVADVECAVLPASLVAAEPLLGGTFLNNFVYKMDVAKGEMHMAVIAGNPKVTTAGGTKTSSKSTGGKS